MTRHDATSVSEAPAEAAIPRLLADHGDQIYALGLRLCGNAADAEDIVQDTFMQAFRKWDQFEGRAKPSTWLYTIASRLCKRKRRKRAGEPSHIPSLSELLPFNEQGVPQFATNDESPLDKQFRRESRERVDQAIGELPVHYRLPLVLHEILEMPLKEIADILDLKEATVKTRVHRGRLLLRKALLEGQPMNAAPEPAYPREMCMDFLYAKLEAMDKDVPFTPAQEIICERCKSVFRTLDVTRDLCAALGSEHMPDSLRQEIQRKLEREGRNN